VSFVTDNIRREYISGKQEGDFAWLSCFSCLIPCIQAVAVQVAVRTMPATDVSNSRYVLPNFGPDYCKGIGY
jgi:hypothetical protein